MKVLLVAGVLLVLLLAAAVVVGVFVVRRYGPGLVEAGRQTFADGAEYGRLTDNEGCLHEAAARHARAVGFTDMVKNNVFLRACLEASRPSPGFCDGVPGRADFMEGIRWQAVQCKRYGLTLEQQCGQLFQQVQQFCEERRWAGGANANTP